ncbi:imidazolonepropionase [soil metagenome]
MSLVFEGAAQVVPMMGEGPLRGTGLGDIEPVAGASLACSGDRIVESLERVPDVEIDARGCTLVPGFVDCHTHLPFFGWRDDEDAARLAGERYEALHRGEGGIFRSARLLAEASDAEVLQFSSGRAGEMLAHGTTSFDAKSGYGLSVAGELRQLALANRLAKTIPQNVAVTCLAAHAVPRGRTADEWIDVAATELLPRAKEEEGATACDLYVESIAFSLGHAERLALAAAELGLVMRVHADQLSDGGAARRAAELEFASADHLNFTAPRAARKLAAGDTAAVLLPGATFTLRQEAKPPARALVDAGAVIALGTDLNPGTSPVVSMPFVMALACRLYGLTPMEALAAATVNAAHVLGLADVGRAVGGYRADLVLLDAPSFEAVLYRPDVNPVLAVVAAGELVPVAPRAKNRVTVRRPQAPGALPA